MDNYWCVRCKRKDVSLIRMGRKKLKSGVSRQRYICRDCNHLKYIGKYTTSKVGGARMDRYRKNNPNKVASRERLNYLLKKGVATRPGRCSRCKQAGKIEAHHTDYDNDVYVWLCRRCHRDAHYIENEVRGPFAKIISETQTIA